MNQRHTASSRTDHQPTAQRDGPGRRSALRTVAIDLARPKNNGPETLLGGRLANDLFSGELGLGVGPALFGERLVAPVFIDSNAIGKAGMIENAHGTDVDQFTDLLAEARDDDIAGAPHCAAF